MPETEKSTKPNFSSILKNKIKNYFAPVFDAKQKEKGALPIVWVLLQLALVAGVGAAVYSSWEKIAATSVGAVLYLMVGLSAGIARFSGMFFNAVGGNVLLSKSITQSATVLSGWAITRDFANMFVVLGFVVVGIATILRIREYEAQKTLFPLIIVALLINFSLLFCGLIIDATNITMNYFLNPVSGPGVSSPAITQPLLDAITNPLVVDNIKGLATNNGFADFDFISAAAGYSITAFVTAMIFFIYGILFLFRYVALMCLVVLSPLGFVCYVFPATHGVYKKWWEQFVQWSIIGIPTAFFVYLGGHLMVEMGLASSNPTSGVDLAFFIPAGFLLFAYSLIFQTSALGASAAIGLATGAMGYMRGAAKWGGGKALRLGAEATGASRAGQWAKNKIGQAGEFLHLKSEGSTARARDKEREEVTKNVAGLTEDRKTQLATGKGFTRWTKEGADKREAAIRDKITNGNLGDLGDSNAQHQALAWLESRERSRGVGKAGELSTVRASASKSNPLLAGMDAAYVARESAKSVAGGGPALTKQDVNYTQLKKSWKDMSLNARSKIDFADPSTLSNTQAEAFVLAHASDVAEATRAATDPSVKTANTIYLKSMIGAPGGLVAGKKIDDAIDTARSGGDVATDRDLSKAKRIIHSL